MNNVDIGKLETAVLTAKEIKNGINQFPIEAGGISYSLLTDFLDETISELEKLVKENKV